jgi:hypothetical protein
MGSIPPISTKPPPFAMKGGFALNKPFFCMNSDVFDVLYRKAEAHRSARGGI